jgi:hypothetical protein
VKVGVVVGTALIVVVGGFVLSLIGLGAAAVLVAGWPERGDMWPMVQGVGQLAGAGVALLGLAGIFLGVAQLQSQDEAKRLDSMPYSRADLIYADGNDGAEMLLWEAEKQISELTRSRLRRGAIVLNRQRSVEFDPSIIEHVESTEALLMGDGRARNGRLRIALRVENQQQAPLGLAQELTVAVHLWGWQGGPDDRPTHPPPPIAILFPYVEPCKAYMLPIIDVAVSPTAPVMLEMAVAEVTYRGLAGNRKSGCHGYLSLVLSSNDIPSGLGEFRVQDREVIP